MTKTPLEDNWETDEVIRHLINDEGVYSELLGEDAETIEQFVRNNPEGLALLYESFASPPKSDFSDVNWESVAESLAEEE